MAEDLFRVEDGFEIEEGPSWLATAGVPGAEVFTDAALVGSWCTDTTTGDIYKKKTTGTGTDKWELSIGATELNAAVGSQQWRESVLVRDDTTYGNLAAAETAVNLGTIDGVSVGDGDRILFTDITGQAHNVFIVNGAPPGATLVEDTKALQEGDALIINRGTYEDELHEYTGVTNDWQSTGSNASAELAFIRAFIGKALAGSEVPGYSSTNYATGSLEDAIGAIDAARCYRCCCRK